MKRFLTVTIFICSLLIVTACGNEKQDILADFELIPSENDIIAIIVGGVDENGISTDETTIIVEEKHKISQVIDLLDKVVIETVEKEYVLEQEYHKMISYNIFFVEDFNSQKHSSLWLLNDGETIIFPTWEEQYYIKSDAESLYQEILNHLEVEF